MAKQNLGDALINSLHEALAYTQGKGTAKTHHIEIPHDINVKAIRKRLHLSRTAFSHEFGMSARTLQHWEQGDRQPQGSARILLLLLQKAPEVISNILHSRYNHAS